MDIKIHLYAAIRNTPVCSGYKILNFNKMIITRKIQVFVYDTDVAQKKEYIHTLYSWRDLVRRGANMIVAHKFAQQNIRDFVYLKDEIKDKFYVKDILKEGKGMSEGLKKEVDEMLTIPMTGHVQSLNASVAASLLMYEVFRQRGFESL